jgi:hypothetical protein
MTTKYTHYFWSFVIVLASVRGVFVYHLGLPPNAVYTLSAALLVYFGLLSFRSMWITKAYKSLISLKRAIKLNAFLIGFYMLLLMLTFSLDQYSMTYLFAIFPIIFALVRYDERLLNGIVYVITLVTVFGVVYFYNIGISAGFDAIEAANLTLRPGDLSYSRIGENLLPAGYQGDHHDAANILVMCSTFLLSKAQLAYSVKNRFLYFSVYSIVLFVTLLTGSAANIIVLISIGGLSLFFYVKKNPHVIVLFFLVLLSLLFNLDALSDYTYFYEKIIASQSDKDGGGIFRSLDLNSIMASFHSILFGFGYAFNVPMTTSEIGFVKTLISVGFIPFLILIFICFSPLYYIYNLRKNDKAHACLLKYHNPEILAANFIKISRAYQVRLIIIAMPVFAGIMTLLHYGSLFRVTSVGLFCVLLALFFKEYLAINKAREIQWPLHKLDLLKK